MPSGLQVWSETGILRLDTNTRVAKFLGTVNTNGTDGSISTDSGKGTPFAYAVPDSQPSYTQVMPNVWFTGTTLNWAYPYFIFTDNKPTTIVYGYF